MDFGEAVLAVYSGELDLDARGREYEKWVEKLALSPVPDPDGFSSPATGQRRRTDALAEA